MNGRINWVLSVGLLTVGLMWRPAIASAQDAEQPSDADSGEAARGRFQRGEAAYAVGNYELAIQEWAAAYALDPRPRIQFNLSMAYERIGRLQEAIDALDHYIQQARPDDPRFADANARIAALRQRLALTGVLITGAPANGEIMIDGHSWGNTPRPDKITLRPGSHRLVIQWVNGAEYMTNFVLQGGQEVTIEVDMSPDETEPVADAPPPDPLEAESVSEPPPPTESTNDWSETTLRGPESTASTSTPLITPATAPAYQSGGGSGGGVLLIAAGGGAAGIGVLTLAWGINRHRELDVCGDPALHCTNGGTIRTQRAVGLGLGALLLAGGGALVGIGFSRLGSSDDGGYALRMGVGPGSVSLGGSF